MGYDVRKSQVNEIAAFYEAPRTVHDKVPEVKIWADVEVSRFEGMVYQRALLPAAFSRVVQQLDAVSAYVDTLLVYQYLGLMNKPGTAEFAGHADSTGLYRDYTAWLRMNWPGMLKTRPGERGMAESPLEHWSPQEVQEAEDGRSFVSE